MNISVIGGGITGLATALCLHRLGISCRVYEKAPALHVAGAGIMMQPNAMRILDHLGVGEEVRSSGIRIDRALITGYTLKPIRLLEGGLVTDDEGCHIISIHRASLQRILYGALPEGIVHVSHEYRNHQTENDIITVTFQEKNVRTGLLLAADGIHSRVRNNLFPGSRLRNARQTCWRGVARIALPEEFHATGCEAWGRGSRLGFAAISDNEVYWYAVKSSGYGNDVAGDNVKAGLLRLFKNYHPLVHDFISATPDKKIIRDVLMDLKRLDTWYRDRVCLLGDAAHATTPNMGQGGCQGIEDAWYMSHILATTPDYREAFPRFESVRRAKVDSIVNNSWRFGKLVHSGPGRFFLKLLMRFTPDAVIRRRMRKMYSVKLQHGNMI